MESVINSKSRNLKLEGKRRKETPKEQKLNKTIYYTTLFQLTNKLESIKPYIISLIVTHRLDPSARRLDK